MEKRKKNNETIKNVGNRGKTLLEIPFKRALFLTQYCLIKQSVFSYLSDRVPHKAPFWGTISDSCLEHGICFSDGCTFLRGPISGSVCAKSRKTGQKARPEMGAGFGLCLEPQNGTVLGTK